MKEQEKLAIVMQYTDGAISGKEAAEKLGITIRQIQRKKKAYLERGMSSIIHGSKHKPSKRGYTPEFKDYILNLYNDEYPGWNFSHFRDTLADTHGIIVSRAFIHKLLTRNGIKSPNRKKHKPKSHPPRKRRENAGELVQVDASKHQWLYGTDEYFYLHGAIDDATGIVTACIMLEQETIHGYQLLMQETIKHYGIPACLYTDYRTVFQSSSANKEQDLEGYLNGKEAKDTRFTAMWHKLGSDIISTTNPRAKGRIERLWRTFQDRLQKELQKMRISSLEEANRYIRDTFLPRYNARFASKIDPKRNLFVPVQSSFNYNRELAVWTYRTVLNGCYVSLNGKYYVVKKRGKTARIITSERLPVYYYLDDSLHLEYKGQMYDLELVPKNIARPKVTKIKQPELTDRQRSENSRKASQNSPWRAWNPDFCKKPVRKHYA